MSDFNYLLLWIALPAVLLAALLCIHSIAELVEKLKAYWIGRQPEAWQDHNLNPNGMRDPLTQLPNRSVFMKKLQNAIRRAHASQSKVAVALINLDDFKPVKNTLHHLTGDAVLKIIAKRLEASLRGADIACRIGGDAFLLLIQEVKTHQEIELIIQRLIDSLISPLNVNDHAINLSISVGIGTYPAIPDTDHLIICADTAMYQAKSAGRNLYRFYDEEMGVAGDQLQELQLDLKQALENNEFELYFQPKVDAQHGHIRSLEALIRWRHPVKGSILPTVFIQAAERFGLISRIHHWVVEECCRTMHRLRSQGLHTQISVNLAAQQLRDPALVHHIVELLDQFQLPHSCLVFEVSGLMALKHPDIFNARMAEFQSAGIDIALDDFGITNASIAYLQKVQQVKLDRKITIKIAGDKKSYEMTDALIRLAHSLDLIVVAEGIENEAQARCLRELKCDMMQGHLLGHPVSADKLAPLLEQRSTKVD
jgi:diguanylate cyclase